MSSINSIKQITSDLVLKMQEELENKNKVLNQYA